MNYDWTLKNTTFTKDQGKVFSCFACGGGSTMGYKLAGFDVLGCNEIDPKMIDTYKKNHSPKYAFLGPIQDFKLRDDLPDDLYNLDILDGSPPCSSFSMAGNREKDWGKNKKFREGQAEQVLDNLFFDFIDLAEKLKPKVVVAENVKGLLMGNAKEYVRNIYKAFDEAGYYCQHWLLNGRNMGVPQKRERVFFVCLRKDLAGPLLYQKDMFTMVPKLELDFNEPDILFKDVSHTDKGHLCTWKAVHIWDEIEFGAFAQKHPKGQYFGAIKVNPNDVCPTYVSNGGSQLFDYKERRYLSLQQACKVGSYPQDYNFNGQDFKYYIGMSVPPLMTGKLAEQINKQWLKKLHTEAQ